MNAKRKKIQIFVLGLMAQLDSTGENKDRYRKLFSSWSDNEFDKWMKAIRDGKTNLFIYLDNTKQSVSMNKLVKLAKTRKLKLFEKLKLHDESIDRSYLTHYEYMVIRVPVRRLSQYIAHKISLPESDSKVNPVTGQVIPPDKGAKLSMVETSILGSKDLKTSAVELLKIRGGDITAYQSAKHQIEDEGTLTMESLPLTNRPRSVVTANVYLNAIGVDTNL